MPTGYAGRIAHIDLTRKTTSIEEPTDQFYRQYCGGSARRAEGMFTWGREAVEKGLQEQRTGIRCVDFTIRFMNRSTTLSKWSVLIRPHPR